MGIFDGMNQISTGGRRFLDEGTYRVRITKIGSKTADQSFKGHPSFFVEFEIVESTSKACPAGLQASWAQPIKAGDTQRKMSISNIKQFLAAALGMMTIFDVPDPTTGVKPSAEQIAEVACSPAQPFTGRLVGVKVAVKKTRAATDFSKHDWFPLT